MSKKVVVIYSGGMDSFTVLNKAIRQGPWKLVAKHRQPWELYNLEIDRTEQTNLASQQPSKVQEMEAKWQQWASQTGVQPWPVTVR